MGTETKKTTLGFDAGVAVARMVVASAEREIKSLSNDPLRSTVEARLAVRGAALRALYEIYYELLTEAARRRLRRMKSPPDKTWVTGTCALLALAGWESLS